MVTLSMTNSFEPVNVSVSATTKYYNRGYENMTKFADALEQVHTLTLNGSEYDVKVTIEHAQLLTGLQKLPDNFEEISSQLYKRIKSAVFPNLTVGNFIIELEHNKKKNHYFVGFIHAHAKSTGASMKLADALIGLLLSQDIITGLLTQDDEHKKLVVSGIANLDWSNPYAGIIGASAPVKHYLDKILVQKNIRSIYHFNIPYSQDEIYYDRGLLLAREAVNGFFGEGARNVSIELNKHAAAEEVVKSLILDPRHKPL